MSSEADEKLDELFSFGVRLSASQDAENVDLYVLMLYDYNTATNDPNRPLTHNGRIVFFRDYALADRVLQLGDEAFRKFGKAPDDLKAIYEPLKALALVEHGEYDEKMTVLNLANELTDFVGATRWALPDVHRRALFPFLDHATFDKDLSAYFETAPGGRMAVVNALLWCFGAVGMNSVIYEDPKPEWL